MKLFWSIYYNIVEIPSTKDGIIRMFVRRNGYEYINLE